MIRQDWKAALIYIVVGAVVTYLHFHPQIKAKKQEKVQQEVANSHFHPQKNAEKQEEMKVCPYCATKLNIELNRKQLCPFCSQIILFCNGHLVTEDEAYAIDWLKKMESLKVSRKQFDTARERLSAQIGKRANSNDTVWSILNSLVDKYANGEPELAFVYKLMAEFLADEDKDPTRMLVLHKNAKNKLAFDLMKKELTNRIKEYEFNELFDLEKAKKELANLKYEPLGEQILDKSNQLPLSNVILKYVRRLTISGKFIEAEELLSKAEPSDAVTKEYQHLAAEREKYSKN